MTMDVREPDLKKICKDSTCQNSMAATDIFHYSTPDIHLLHLVWVAIVDQQGVTAGSTPWLLLCYTFNEVNLSRSEMHHVH